MTDEQEGISTETALFQEALAAIEKKENARARELLTRLIKTNPANPDYWLWMSAAVETRREQVYCLKETLRADPNNAAAQRGLALFGEIPPNPQFIIPIAMQRRKWQVKVPVEPTEKKAFPLRNLLFILGGVTILAVLSVFLLVNRNQPIIPEVSVRQPLLPTSGPTATFLPTASPVVKRTVHAATTGPTPLWMSLEATYTPTPIYVATPRQIEAYQIAIRAYGRGEYDKALSNLSQVITAEPKAADLQFHLGEIYRLQGKNNLAIEAYNRSIALDKAFAPPYLGLGQSILALNASRWQEAEKNFRKAIELDPNINAAYLELAGLYVSRNDGEAALAELDAAPQSVQSSPFYFYYRAAAQMQLDQPEMALQEAQVANRMDITILPVYRLLGEAYIKTGQVAAAAEPLGLYVRYVPDDDKAWGWLGAAYGATDQLDLALEAFNSAIALNRYSYDAYYQRGMIYLRQEDGEKALKDMQIAVGSRPNSFEANIGLGRAFMLQEVYGNAWKYFATSEAFAQSAAQKAEMLYWRAQSLEALEQLPSAVRDYNTLAALQGDAEVPAEFVNFALQRLSILSTPTLTPNPSATGSTIGASPTPTLTPGSTGTPTPTATPTP